MAIGRNRFAPTNSEQEMTDHVFFLDRSDEDIPHDQGRLTASSSRVHSGKSNRERVTIHCFRRGLDGVVVGIPTTMPKDWGSVPKKPEKLQTYRSHPPSSAHERRGEKPNYKAVFEIVRLNGCLSS
ncbi:hypothetical protein AAG570_005853 [Ranatra chinensis]|uniref:Uncharacterized protein n=1 Tax=Ranatra chinensis TaxID=642074 RepID=A0ABD0Y9B0_9HEMI